ncbi:MAG: hypothetical protein DMG79_07985 [Acidobacteria bacterium]|nr:MAG: hypothetical protein DMG79_07985 [Acidobacteriota bacterium]
MAKITILFEGQRRELNEFGFAIFDQMIRYDVPLDVPGNMTLTLRPEGLRKSVGPGVMEVVLNLAEGFTAGIFANWLYGKWQKSGEPRSITIKIENRYYQLDPEVLAKALEGAAKKAEKAEEKETSLRS